jgi:hypothetical protein
MSGTHAFAPNVNTFRNFGGKTKSLSWSGLCITKIDKSASRTQAYNLIQLKVPNNRQMDIALVLISDYVTMNYI